MLPPGVTVKKVYPAELFVDGKLYRLVEDEFNMSAEFSRGPFYSRDDTPLDVWMPDLAYLLNIDSNPAVMHRIQDTPTELDEPLRAFTRQRLADLE